MPLGVPGFMSQGGPNSLYFIQMPKEVRLVIESNQQVRRVLLDVPHSANPKPTWYGESVGHYEGDTLVIDTIGLNDKTVVDVYRTPHTEKLHVVERWRIIDGGQMMEVTFTVDDPDAFHQPWSAMRRYRRAQNAAEKRKNSERRRLIDPTTCERDYNDDETEFMKAMDRYKRENRRPFPTWSEVLEVLRSLGYRRVAEPTALPGGKKEKDSGVTQTPAPAQLPTKG